MSDKIRKKKTMSDKIRTIHVPIFMETKINKRYDNDMPTDEIIPSLEVLQTNISLAVETFMNISSEADRPMIFMCVAQKTEDDRKMGICCFSFNHDDIEELVVDISNIAVNSKFTIVGKP